MNPVSSLFIKKVEFELQEDSHKLETSFRKEKVLSHQLIIKDLETRKKLNSLFENNDKEKQKRKMEEFKIKQQEILEKREKNKQHRDEVIKNYKSKQHLKLQNTLSKFREIQIKDRNESKDETQLIAQQRINNWKDHFRLLLKNEKDNEEKRKQNMIELDMIKNKLLEYENKMPKNEIDKIKKDQLNEKSLNASENIKIHQLKSLSINKESEEKNLEEFLKTISKIKDAQSKRQQEIQKKSIFLNKEKRKIEAVKDNK